MRSGFRPTNPSNFKPSCVQLAALLLVVLVSGCSSAYYGAMEKFGVQKREILVSRVGKAKQAQQETKEEFASALDAYMAVVNVPGSDLETKYRTLLDAYERSKAQADELDNRIDAVEDVANALFKEWQKEIKQYENKSLAASSSRKLADTKRRYAPMLKAMRDAQSKVDPVLSAFNDQVLYLKHNLNAQSIQALKGEVQGVQADVSALVSEMERSIQEADSFISQMESQGS